MTNEDKKLIADYMGWDGTTTIEGYAIPTPEIHYFDLNDAGLIVKEMVKRGDWEGSVAFVEETPENRFITWNQLIAWLFNADNFFTAFVEWRKGNEKTNHV
jgi:hypothetical protein